MSFYLIYLVFILIALLIGIWANYTLRIGKRSQRSLRPLIKDLQAQTKAQLFVCMYAHEGNAIIYFDDDSFYAYGPKGVLVELPKSQVTLVEYSRYGFCHVVTADARYKFAYIHFAKEATQLYTPIFGREYRNDKAIAAFAAELQRTEWPNKKVSQKTLLFIPQDKI